MQYKNIAEDLILKHETLESFPLKDDEKIFIAGYINAISFTEDWRGIAERAGYDLDSGLDGFIAPDFIRKAICDCLGFISAAPARIWLDGSNNHWHDPDLIREIASLFWYTRNGIYTRNGTPGTLAPLTRPLVAKVVWHLTACPPGG